MKKQFNKIWFENIKIKKRVSNFNWEKHTKTVEYFMPLKKQFFWYNIKAKNY